MTGPSPKGEPVPRTRPAALLTRGRALLKAHWLFAAVLAAATALRALTMLGLRPAEIYWYDSYEYLRFALHPKPAHDLHPGGYGFFLLLLRPFHSIVLIIAIQHLMGLAIGLLTYAVLRRRSRPVWVAVLATIPALFDVELLHLEQAVLSDTMFILLIVGAVSVLLWSPTISTRAAVSAGLLVALAALVRTIALPLLILLLVWLALRRVGWRALVSATVLAMLPIVSYACWYDATYGRFKLAGGDGAALWARSRTFADCSVIKPPADEARLCPDGIHQDAAAEYYWSGEINRPPGRQANEDLARSFAIHAIMAQPVDYLRNVGEDVALAFAWPAVRHPRRLPAIYYFTARRVPLSDHSGAKQTIAAYDPSVRDTHAVRPYSSALVAYKAHLPGPLLGVILLLGLFGMCRRGPSPGGRMIVLLPWGVATALLVLPVVVLDFDHRYVMPVPPLACLAAALAYGRRPARPARVSASPELEDVVGGSPEQSPPGLSTRP
ncbi:hypothetical protein NE236_17510 [Actinoallomurus purpureus]|uniref:hypothetical protein n=1 Tax=Actinoallomurus purpureus TaxID=478114 RepID=UPI002093D3F5|nr:hypothetical protein [Actinoallomurus purpureus]MCO6006786.1 hypothetical protein [Actinoallomurus purpureus]